MKKSKKRIIFLILFIVIILLGAFVVLVFHLEHDSIRYKKANEFRENEFSFLTDYVNDNYDIIVELSDTLLADNKEEKRIDMSEYKNITDISDDTNSFPFAEAIIDQNNVTYISPGYDNDYYYLYYYPESNNRPAFDLKSNIEYIGDNFVLMYVEYAKA